LRGAHTIKIFYVPDASEGLTAGAADMNLIDLQALFPWWITARSSQQRLRGT